MSWPFAGAVSLRSVLRGVLVCYWCACVLVVHAGNLPAIAKIDVGLEEDTAVHTLAGVANDDTSDAAAASSASSNGGVQKEKFYTPASDELLAFRITLAPRSFKAAAERLTREKRRRTDSSQYRAAEEAAAGLYASVSEMHCTASQIGDKRPISSVKYSPCEKRVLTTSWSGLAAVWARATLERERKFSGHTCRVLEADWHPKSGLDGGPSMEAVNFATASSDGTARLWSLESEKPLQTFKGHTRRLARVAWHGSGEYLATTSYDHTWRLWHPERQQEVGGWVGGW